MMSLRSDLYDIELRPTRAIIKSARPPNSLMKVPVQIVGLLMGTWTKKVYFSHIKSNCTRSEELLCLFSSFLPCIL